MAALSVRITFGMECDAPNPTPRLEVPAASVKHGICSDHKRRNAPAPIMTRVRPVQASMAGARPTRAFTASLATLHCPQGGAMRPSCGHYRDQVV